MVVLAPGRQIEAADIPTDVREGGTRLLPARVSAEARGAGRGQELRFIFQSLVELKMQIEDLQRRMDGQSAERIEVVEVRTRLDAPGGDHEIIQLTKESIVEPDEDDESVVVYRQGMKMQDVERAAIEAVLAETGGNRRRAAEQLGIGERTLYRKIKEFGLM
jgi:DNA-binding NtrC family response regulator